MILIKNGTLYTMEKEGIQDQTDILLGDGKILAIGRNLQAENARVIDAAGKLVFPGFIDAHTHLGMWEDGIGFEGADGNEMTDPITPHLRAIDAINPMDRTFAEALEAGITAVATGPGSANVIGGTFTAIKTWGHRVDEMVIKDPVAMKCAFGENPKRVYSEKKASPSTRMAIAAELRKALYETREYLKQKNQGKQDPGKMPKYDMKLEALIPVINGEIPLKAHAHRADDLFTAIRIAREFDIKVTLEHVTEGHLIAGELAKEGYPVVVGPSLSDRSKFELRNLTFDTPGVLSRAGLQVAITTDAPVVPLQYLPLVAGLAVKWGMAPDRALEAITLNPAQILGIDGQVGSLKVGKDGDILIFDTHPFELQARPRMVIIDGEIRMEREM
ncbi:MAG: amidohydrolase [delta proteobacterium ML8_F1]|nr:MAG: amidohydrolase [delta proteobacterium ML8_F1]